jgi:hypothetical protein
MVLKFLKPVKLTTATKTQQFFEGFQISGIISWFIDSDCVFKYPELVDIIEGKDPPNTG